MKKTEIVVREFSLKDKKIITSKDLKTLCEKYKFNFRKTKVSLLNKGYLVTIFRGIFYLKDYNEKKTGVIKYSSNELLSLGLKERGIKNWYLGLNTALKILNLTHEIFPVNCVFNDKFNRINSMEIVGSKYLFRKINKRLFSFGLKKTQTPNGLSIKYSDTEKTLIDMIYLAMHSGKSKGDSISIINEYRGSINKKKIFDYATRYPKTVRKAVSEALK